MTENPTEVEETENQITEDPEAIQNREVEEYSQKVAELHDTLETVKNVSEQLADEINSKAEGAYNEELEQRYTFLANTALKAKNRVEVGDTQLLRNNL